MRMNIKRRTITISVLFFLAVLAFVMISIPVSAQESRISGPEDDRIYFFALSGDPEVTGDMILVESNGHFGLIDASYRSERTIEDEEGNTHTLSLAEHLWNPDINGLNYAEYMIDTLGVTHLDFIIGTHAHSDHIGGIPDIAQLEYQGIRLVDTDTVYLYKEYFPVNYIDDDAWMNVIFSYQAKKTMEETGAGLVSLNQSHFSTEIEEGLILDYSEQISRIDQVFGLSQAQYQMKDPENAYDDLLAFQMGDFTISLYNLFSTPTYLNENVNSICTLITKGDQKILSLADINDEQQVAQKIAKAISNDMDGQRVSLLKDAHHATPRGSNTKEEADLYRPMLDVSSKLWTSSTVNNKFANFKYYCETKYGTVFYSVGDADAGLVAFVSDDAVILRQMTGRGAEFSLTDPVVNERTTWDGWHVWDYEFDLYNSDKSSLYWTYFIDGVPQTGWQKVNDSWYYFDKNGFMQTGWLKYGSDWYYLNSSGAMQTGWLKLQGGSGSWYYLDSSGRMQVGLKEIGQKTYYFDLSGAMQTGWQWVNGKTLFFDDTGAMVTYGWTKYQGQYYFMN